VSAAYGRYPAFPFRIGEDGRTALVADRDQHVREEVLQLILTAVGERLFQPTFGTNVRRLVFENLDEVAAGITKSTITQALSRWLGARAEIEELVVETADSTITVDLRYRPAGSPDARVLRLQRTGE
jgi:phage baseplate assembly protein W